jgi:hypothetical protein
VNILGRDDQRLSQQTQRVAVVNNLFVDVDSAVRGGTGRLYQLVNNANAVTIDHNTAINAGTVLYGEGVAHTNVVFTNNIASHNDYGVIGSGTGVGTGTIVVYFPGSVFGADALVGGPAASYPAGNYFPATMNEVGFVDPASGNYRLNPASPCRGLATDGTDLGANIDTIDAAIAGTGGGGGGTPTGDTSAPVIGGPMVDEATTSTATVSWTTDEAADGQVEYGTTMALGTSTPLDTVARTGHSATIAGLSPDTSYYFRVRSRDAAGNLASSSIYVLRTLAPPPPDPGVVEQVLWTHLVRCNVQGTSLVKIAGRSGKPDATAASSQRIVSGDGYVEFTATSATTERWLGLGRDSAAADPNAIDFCVRLTNRGKLLITERGTRVKSLNYAPGDVIRIAIEGGTVKYMRNGVVVHTSPIAPVYPLYVNAALVTMNASLDHVMIAAATSSGLGRYSDQQVTRRGRGGRRSSNVSAAPAPFAVSST